ncbi:MAG: biopolymer transport protein TolR [Bermanella sp.]|jgi:biopolymer transport protein TolR
MLKAKRKKRKPMADMNVVPYIDVMLVLLIVFMVTAPLLMQGVQVELPKAPAEPMGEQKDEPLIVSVKADGSLYINVGDSEKARLLEDIAERVRKVMKQKPETKVLVWGDQAVRYGEVVSLMAALQSAGAPSVGLVTENPR